MLSNMIDRLFPLLSGWNNFEGIIGAVLALLLGLWIGWDWEWKKLGVFGLSCAVIYGLGVWIEGSQTMYLGGAWHGRCGADAGSDPEYAGGQAVVCPAESQFEQLR